MHLYTLNSPVKFRVRKRLSYGAFGFLFGTKHYGIWFIDYSKKFLEFVEYRENSNYLNVKPKPLFPIFSDKKADTNFTSSKTPVFAAKANDKLNDVRPPNPRKKSAKAPKTKKISIPQGNTMLKYFKHLPGDELKQETPSSFHPNPSDCWNLIICWSDRTWLRASVFYTMTVTSIRFWFQSLLIIILRRLKYI